MVAKTLTNKDPASAKKNVPDIEVVGDPDAWKLLCKASSKKEGWMKSTKGMEIRRTGVLIQTTTQQGDNVADALQFIPGVRLADDGHGGYRLEKAP